jgi:hypothetical protein
MCGGRARAIFEHETTISVMLADQPCTTGFHTPIRLEDVTIQMMRRCLHYLLFAVLVSAAALPAVAGAQSLTDVAKAEEARRKTVKRPAKVYTNDDLKPSTDPAPAPDSARTAAPSSNGSAAAQAPAPAPAPDAAKTSEKYWRDRITQTRDALAHDKVLLDAVQSRINALTTDFVNTADPAQRAVIETNRITALAELDRLNKDAQLQTKAISDIQEEARKASVPAGWLR